MNGEYFIGVIMGFVLGAFVSAAVVSESHSKILRECEKELPRTQHCKLIAVKAEE